MKIYLLLCSALLGMCLIMVAVFFFTDEPDRSHGFPHATFADSMQQGGSGVERHAVVRWWGLAFGTLQIIFFVSCLVLGVRDSQRPRWIFLLGGLAYMATFWALVFADYAYAQDDAPSLVLGFPLPTALMLYGLWSIPLVFMVFYIVRFERCILDPQELEEFQRAAQQRRNREEATH